MTRQRQFVVVLIGIVLLAQVGCEKKKPQLPRQAKAPAEPVAMPLPPEISEETPQQSEPPSKEETAKSEEPKPQTAKHRKRKQPPTPPPTQSATANPPSGSPNSTLAAAHAPGNPANEAPPDTAIAADVTSAQLIQQKQTTAQLLDATEKAIGGLSHTLSHDEEQMVAQIRSYVTQSRKATTDGDFERAYNLATKAHLLSDALVKK